MLIFHRLIQGTLAEFLSTDITTKKEGTRFEVDTGDSYILKNGMWVNENPIIPSISTAFSKFIPFPDQTGLTFGDAWWRKITAELMSDGSMVYQAKTSASVINDGAGMGIFDFALPEMYPKVEMTFKFDDLGTNTNAVIGMFPDSVNNAFLDSGSFWIANDTPSIAVGYKSADSNLFVYRNDATGAVNSQDTTIARTTDPIHVIIQFLAPQTAFVSISDMDNIVLFSQSYTTEIPALSTELGFYASITNFNTTAQYGINMYDYVYLEKRIPTPTGVLT